MISISHAIDLILKLTLERHLKNQMNFKKTSNLDQIFQ